MDKYMAYKCGINSNQLYLTCNKNEIDENSVVYLILLFLDSINLKEIDVIFFCNYGKGRPRYNPYSLLALLIYGYYTGIRSSRALERLAKDSCEGKYLMKGLCPDHNTINRFRKSIIKKAILIFEQFNNFISIKNGIGCVSVDGTKICANNARKNNYTRSSCERQIKYLIKSINKLNEEIIKHYNAENSSLIDKLIDKIRKKQKKLEEVKVIQAYMEKHNLTQYSCIDSDSKLMKYKDGFAVAYNAQMAIDTKNHYIVGLKVLNKPVDNGSLYETVSNLREEDKILNVTADKGYVCKEDMIKCLFNGIIPHVILLNKHESITLEVDYKPYDKTRKNDDLSIEESLSAGIIPSVYKHCISNIRIEDVIEKEYGHKEISGKYTDKKECIAKAAEGYFVRHRKSNVVYCLEGKKLYKISNLKDGSTTYGKCNDCKKCRKRKLCYTGKQNSKTIIFKPGQEIVLNIVYFRKIKLPVPLLEKDYIETKKSVKKVLFDFTPDREITALRMSTSEHPFGTIKRYKNGYYVLLKGLENVEGEISLISLGYNLRKYYLTNLINIKYNMAI